TTALHQQIAAQERRIHLLELHGDFPQAKQERQLLSRLYVRSGRNPDGSERLPFAFGDPDLKVKVEIPDSFAPIESVHQVDPISGLLSRVHIGPGPLTPNPETLAQVTVPEQPRSQGFREDADVSVIGGLAQARAPSVAGSESRGWPPLIHQP